MALQHGPLIGNMGTFFFSNVLNKGVEFDYLVAGSLYFD